LSVYQYDFAPDRKMSRSAMAAKILSLLADMITKVRKLPPHKKIT